MLKVSALTAGYGRIVIIRDLTFEVASGTVTCLIGSNGAGKTTTIRALFGMLDNRAGSVIMEGVDLLRVRQHRLIDHGLALVPEGRRVFANVSVIDNLKLGSRASEGWRKISDLDKIIALFPELETKLDHPAGLLSGGQQQMVAIGRALMARPRLLVLDEPSMGLAPVLVHRIYQALAELRSEGLSILLVEQNARVALANSDSGYLLESGNIVEFGPAAVIAQSSRVQETYMGVP